MKTFKLNGLKRFAALFTAGVLAAGMFMGAGAKTAKAAEPYKYTVRIFAGGQGSFDGQPCLIYENVPAGAQITFSQSELTIDHPERYHYLCLRESGKDNKDSAATIQTPSFKVTRDADYVVGYGINGDSVPYTVRYVDYDTGEERHSPEQFYGNDGEVISVGYRHIENYYPNGWNQSRTLVKGKNNDITFYYRHIEGLETVIIDKGVTSTTGTTGKTTIVVDYGTTVTNGSGSNSGSSGSNNSGSGSSGTGSSSSDSNAAAGGSGTETGSADGTEASQDPADRAVTMPDSPEDVPQNINLDEVEGSQPESGAEGSEADGSKAADSSAGGESGDSKENAEGSSEAAAAGSSQAPGLRSVSKPALVAFCVGGVGLAGLLAALFIYLLRRNKKEEEQ